MTSGREVICHMAASGVAGRTELGACLPWVAAELALVQPDVLVLLGATAAQALVGPTVRITKDHGRPLESNLAPTVIATIHPSAVLRAAGGRERTESMAGLVHDLETARRHVGRRTRGR
jgi:uracil-DNA glycosylase